VAQQANLKRGTADALVELSRSLSGDWRSSIRRIVQFDAETLGVERVSFWSLSEETASIHCDAGYVVGLKSFEHGATLYASDLPEYFAAMRETRVLDLGDVRKDPRCRGLRDYCAARGISSMLDIPVCVEGRLCGVLCHEHVGATRRWTAREEDFATGIGQVVSSALAARAHTCAEACARRATFLETLSGALSSLVAREVASRAASLPIPWFADGVVVWAVSRDDGLECLALERGPFPKDVPPEARPAAATASERRCPSLASLVVRQKQSMLIPEFSPAVIDCYGISQETRTVLEALGWCTAIGVPLTVGGNTVGAMIFAAGGRHFDADDLALAEKIADRVAAALQNARLYEIACEAIRARDDLLVLVGHELRTPLTALQLMSDSQLRRAIAGGDTAETTRSEHVARQVRRFVTLVDHMLDALRIRSRGVELVTAPVDLATTVQQRVGVAAERSGSRIALESAPSIVGLWDRARLEQVADQLLDNAVKFGEGRPIEVRLRATESEVELSVRDHGIGIPAERLASIFDPFGRAVAKEHFGGLGLGLYVSKAIVDAHGGAIVVTSHPGEGSDFVVRLPLAPRPIIVPGAPPSQRRTSM
jgi:signal transduction histidine kinase